jgi:phosphoglycolate phosphatase
MKPVELLIFDLDGTLVSSAHDIAAAVNYTLTALKKPPLRMNDVMNLVGDGVEKLVAGSIGDAYPERFREALEIFSAYYAEHLLDATDLYPGVEDILEHFRLKNKVIITNKRINFTQKITDGLGISPYFDEIIGADSLPYKKPDARLLLPLLDRFGVGCEQTVVIGDGINDILLAKNAGAISCALLGGLTAEAILRKLEPDFVCNDIRDVTGLFC